MEAERRAGLRAELALVGLPVAQVPAALLGALPPVAPWEAEADRRVALARAHPVRRAWPRACPVTRPPAHRRDARRAMLGGRRRAPPASSVPAADPWARRRPEAPPRDHRQADSRRSWCRISGTAF